MNTVTQDKDSSITSVIKGKFFYGYIIVAAGFFIWLISSGLNQSFGVFYKPLIADFGWSRAETVSAFSITLLVQAAAAIGTGWLTDKLGPRIVVMIFGSFLGISYLLLSQINSLWQFIVITALISSIGLSAGGTPIMATAARWFTRKRGTMIAIIQSGAGIGGFIIAPFASWLIISYSWRSAYIVLGIIALVVIIISGSLLKRAPQSTQRLSDGLSENITVSDNVPKSAMQASGFTLREVVRTRTFWIVLGIYFSFGFCRSTFIPHIAAHVQDMGFSLADGANVLATLTITSIAGRFWLGWFGNRLAFMVSFLVTTIALIWALFTHDLWGLYLFAVIFGFGWGAQAVLRITVAVETVGLVSIGLLMGIWGFAEAGASAMGSYMAGYLFDIYGSYQVAFLIGIPISIAGMVLSAFIKPTSKEKGH